MLRFAENLSDSFALSGLLFFAEVTKIAALPGYQVVPKIDYSQFHNCFVFLAECSKPS